MFFSDTHPGSATLILGKISVIFANALIVKIRQKLNSLKMKLIICSKFILLSST
jgi:hypothetical protein